MAIYIQITKLKQINEMHYYDIDTQDFDYTKPLCIGIDTKYKKLYFFINSNLQESVDTFDLQNLPAVLKSNYAPFNLLHSIFKKSRQAIDKSEYPQFLDYAA